MLEAIIGALPLRNKSAAVASFDLAETGIRRKGILVKSHDESAHSVFDVGPVGRVRPDLSVFRFGCLQSLSFSHL